MERIVGLIDQAEFLSQDRCERPVITRRQVWTDKIQIWLLGKRGYPLVEI
jgi:hypothetical protein